MEKQASSLFVNDGSFMERFRQLQQEKEKGSVTQESATPKPSFAKTGMEPKAKPSSSGKFAFSLKQKPKLVAAPVKLDEDEDEDEKEAVSALGYQSTKRQKVEQLDTSKQSSNQVNVAPPPPSHPTVKKVADKLASFVAKHGRQFEDVTRQKNPGDTPFKFLFDDSCDDYKYYAHQLNEEEKSLQFTDLRTSQTGGTSSTTHTSRSVSQSSHQQHPKYQTPASALYEDTEGSQASGESSAPGALDPVAMMEFYAKKAAQEERRRQPKQSKDEMPPPSSLQASSKRGHHMGDYIPDEELQKFMANCDDVAAQKAAKAAADKAKIQADNVGHRLLSKMGWKEGEGLGSSRSGIADPIMAGDVKTNNLGVGAAQPGEVTPEDDIYEQYKKRMMLGYRYRPNPMNNPRKAYY